MRSTFEAISAGLACGVSGLLGGLILAAIISWSVDELAGRHDCRTPDLPIVHRQAAA